MSRYSLSTSTSSVGFTGTPLRARQRPPAFPCAGSAMWGTSG